MKTLSISLESVHFLTFSTKCSECKIKQRDRHGKYRCVHGKVIESFFFIKCTGTLMPRVWRLLILLPLSQESRVVILVAGFSLSSQSYTVTQKLKCFPLIQSGKRFIELAIKLQQPTKWLTTNRSGCVKPHLAI